MKAAEPRLSIANARAEKAYGFFKTMKKKIHFHLKLYNVKNMKIRDLDNKFHFAFRDDGTNYSSKISKTGRQIKPLEKNLIFKDCKTFDFTDGY